MHATSAGRRSGPCEQPAWAIRPGLEVIASITKTDPSPIWAAWELLQNECRPWLRFRYDNQLTCRSAAPIAEAHMRDVQAAIRGAVQPYPMPAPWTRVSFQDQATPELPPQCSLDCTLGPLEARANQRGISLRMTLPEVHDWEKMTALASRLTELLEDNWCWISVGYVFVYVPWYSARLGEAFAEVKGRCRRFRGVDVGDPMGLYTTYWQRHLRTVQWLTLVADRLLRLPEALTRQQRIGGSAIRAVRHGLLVKAGDAPSVWDVNRPGDGAAYRAADALLGDLRAEPAICVPPSWSSVECRQWMQRWTQP